MFSVLIYVLGIRCRNLATRLKCDSQKATFYRNLGFQWVFIQLKKRSL